MENAVRIREIARAICLKTAALLPQVTMASPTHSDVETASVSDTEEDTEEEHDTKKEKAKSGKRKATRGREEGGRKKKAKTSRAPQSGLPARSAQSSR